jgi:hypothetical protein
VKLARIDGADGSTAELYAAVYSIVEHNIERGWDWTPYRSRSCRRASKS